MRVTSQTNIVAGNGPSAFRGVVADVPGLLGYSGDVEVLDATSSTIEVSVRTPSVEYVLEAEVERRLDGTLRIKSVYDPALNQTVCF